MGKVVEIHGRERVEESTQHTNGNDKDPSQHSNARIAAKSKKLNGVVVKFDYIALK